MLSIGNFIHHRIYAKEFWHCDSWAFFTHEICNHVISFNSEIYLVLSKFIVKLMSWKLCNYKTLISTGTLKLLFVKYLFGKILIGKFVIGNLPLKLKSFDSPVICYLTWTANNGRVKRHLWSLCVRIKLNTMVIWQPSMFLTKFYRRRRSDRHLGWVWKPCPGALQYRIQNF